MMTVSETLLLLKQRRAICILLMIFFAIGGWFMINVAIPEAFVAHPKLIPYLRGVAIISFGGFFLLQFRWLWKLFSGIRRLVKMQRRGKLICSTQFEQDYNRGEFDF